MTERPEKRRHRRWRVVAAGVTAALVLAAAASVGLAGGTARGTGARAQLSGEVLVCRGDGEVACVATGAQVTLLRIEGAAGRVVAQRYARDGHYRFVVPPGEYVPGAEIAEAHTHELGCLMSTIVLHPGEKAEDVVVCHRRLRHSTARVSPSSTNTGTG
jgi:hypothetical protein